MMVREKSFFKMSFMKNDYIQQNEAFQAPKPIPFHQEVVGHIRTTFSIRPPEGRQPRRNRSRRIRSTTKTLQDSLCKPPTPSMLSRLKERQYRNLGYLPRPELDDYE